MTKKTNPRQIKKAPLDDSEKTDTLMLNKSDFNYIKLTHSQLKFYKTIKDNFLITCTGPAGTAKTFVACHAALDLLREGAHKKIILARPAVEAGENLGFLPGDKDEKIAPYMEGYLSNMEKIISTEKLKALVENKIIDMQPLAFMRSRTFDDTILILDEAQNADLRQIMLVVTRMGKNSRIVICGDVSQWDIKKNRKDLLTFNDKILKGSKQCEAFEFTREDIVRHPILIELTDKYDAYKEEAGLDK
jgi:phosphate starvation-inducible PhoH-like protein